jgi:hypothetical protein
VFTMVVVVLLVMAPSPPMLPVIGASVAAVEKAKHARETRRMAKQRCSGGRGGRGSRIPGTCRARAGMPATGRDSHRGRDREGETALPGSGRPMKMLLILMYTADSLLGSCHVSSAKFYPWTTLLSLPQRK